MTSEWQTTRADKSIHQKATRYCADIDEDLPTLSMQKYQRKRKIKVNRTTSKMNILIAKELHGQHTMMLKLPEIDQDASIRWLKSSTLKRATESMICAIQEQAITTRYIQRKSHHTTNNDQC